MIDHGHHLLSILRIHHLGLHRHSHGASLTWLLGPLLLLHHGIRNLRQILLHSGSDLSRLHLLIRHLVHYWLLRPNISCSDLLGLKHVDVWYPSQCRVNSGIWSRHHWLSKLWGSHDSSCSRHHSWMHMLLR
jgi:hypothetical protein